MAAGDLDAALQYALRLPGSPSRDELLARIALARGEDQLALEYFIAAPDVDAVQTRIDALERRDPAAAYALERVLTIRVDKLATHPDTVAETTFRMGEIANQQAFREVPDSARQGFWLERAMRDFQSALDRAPFSSKYAIAAGNQAMLLGRLDDARASFARAAAADPASANAVAGLGTIAYMQGDVPSARAYLSRAQRLDRDAPMVRALERFVAQ